MDNTVAVNIKQKNEFKLKNWHLYLFITLMYLLITVITDKYIMTREVYQLLLSEQMESYRIDDYYYLIKRFSVYTYFAVPLIIWIKLVFVALLIQTPLMLKDIEISFQETFKIAVYANIPFVILGSVKLIILKVTPVAEYSENILESIPGSIVNFLDKGNYSQIAYKFLENINIYEISWILIVFLGIIKFSKTEKFDSFIVSSGIWLGLLLLKLIIIFYLNNAF